MPEGGVGRRKMGFKEKVERLEQARKGGDTPETAESRALNRVEDVAEERFMFLKLIDANGLLMTLKDELILPEENPAIRKILRFVTAANNEESLFRWAWPSSKFNLTRKIETELNSKLIQRLGIDALLNPKYALDKNHKELILEAMHTLTWEKDDGKHEISIISGGFLLHGINDGGLQWVMVENGYRCWFLHDDLCFDLNNPISFQWGTRKPGELYCQDKIKNILAEAFFESSTAFFKSELSDDIKTFSK